MERQVSARSRFGYAGADLACNLIWVTVGTYLLVFYTDVAGIPAAAVGTLLLVTRIIDALTDPVIGVLIDRTRTRWGRSRPYLLWASGPLAALAVLTFSMPDVGLTGRIAWAYGTYLALSLVYGLANIPITSLLPAMTTNPHERTTLGAFRALGATAGSVGGGAAFLPLVALLGGGDDARGYRLAMALLALLAAVLLLFAFASVREQASAPVPPTLTGVRALRRNGSLYAAVAAVVLLFVETTGRTAALVYFFRDYLGREDLVPTANVLRVAVLAGLVGCLPTARRIGKRNTLGLGVAVSLVGVAMPIPTGTAPGPVLIGIAISSLGTGLVLGVLYSMAADLIDFSAWLSGVRADGLIAGIVALGAKIGVALGGAFTAWALAVGGYDGQIAAQAPAAVTAIRLAFYGVPSVLLVIVLALLPFYRVERQLPAVRSALDIDRDDIRAG